MIISKRDGFVYEDGYRLGATLSIWPAGLKATKSFCPTILKAKGSIVSFDQSVFHGFIQGGGSVVQRVFGASRTDARGQRP